MTAKEMYQYCKDNGFGEGMTEKWGIKHFSVIEKDLSSDEKVLMCFIGLHNYISATKHDDYFAYVITNKRIIMAQKKLFGEALQSVLIDNLNDITIDTGAIFGKVTFDTMKEIFNVGTNKNSAKNIHSRVQKILFDLKNNKNSSVQSQNISSADELLKYKQLLDMGAITEDEYNEKKKLLLNL